MDFKFSKDSGDSQQQEAPGEKKKQSTLIVLLLILVGGFTYIYFFTDLIKPQEAQKPAEAPASAPQVAKTPLPPREGEAAKPGGNAPVITDTPKEAATAPVATSPPAAKPVAAAAKPASAPAPEPAAKTATAPSKPKEEPKRAEAAKAADKKTLPAPVADKKVEKAAVAKAEVKKPAAAAKKSGVADKKSALAKDGVKKTGSGAQAKQEAVAKAKSAAPGAWSILVGNYVNEEALSAGMGRVRKAGLEPTVKQSGRKKSAMNRLFVSEFNDRAAAQSNLENLKRHTSDAFVIEQGGKFVLYAGSYLQSEAARTEKERLKGAGFTATIKHADIAIPSRSLSVGPFNSKKAADSALLKLKRAGIKASLWQK